MTWFDSLVDHACHQVDDRILESLNARGVSDSQVVEYQVGYLNRDLPPTIECPQHFLEWARGGSKLDDVYVFPLTNILGEIHGLQFRHVARERTGYMDYFAGKGESVLFGLKQAAPRIWETESVFFVEGNFDLFPIQRHDPTVVATLTARVPDALIRFLRRTCSQVVFGYDNDSTGKRGVEQFRKQYSTEFKVRDIQYPKIPLSNGKSVKDSADLWEVWGDPKFGDFLTHHNAMEW